MYGLFYDDVNGKRCPHIENWEQVSFNKEDEALSKLSLIEAERKREDDADPFSLDEAMAFADSHKWKFATTYAKTAPHEYLVKSWLSEDDRKKYERFVATMKKNSVVGYFYGHKNDYFILGDLYYWYMGVLPLCQYYEPPWKARYFDIPWDYGVAPPFDSLLPTPKNGGFHSFAGAENAPLSD